MQRLLYILILFLLTNFSFGQSENILTIEQVSLPNGHFIKYIFDGEKITIRENGKQRQQIKLDQKELKQLDSVMNSIGLDTLQEIYSRPVFDGVNWTFAFNLNGTEKKITLDNYYLENLDILLRKINSFIKENDRIISFGEDMHLKSDTLIYYLPDFYIDSVSVPDAYDSYRIMCFKKGYLVTEILDSIILCDCRIYPVDNNTNNKKRLFWRAFRLQDDKWKRNFYDSDNNIIKTEYIEDIIPYRIIDEKVYTDIGNKPSVEIYRYYETRIEKEESNMR